MKNRQGHKPFNLFGRLQIVQAVIARPAFKYDGRNNNRQKSCITARTVQITRAAKSTANEVCVSALLSPALKIPRGD
jgi:hypothetical protein